MKRKNLMKRIVSLFICAAIAFSGVAFSASSAWEEDNGHDHSYTSKVTRKPTCAKKGIRTYSCECGDEYTVSIAKLKHNYKNSTVKATMKKDGAHIKTCSSCGKKETTTIARIYSVYLTNNKFEFDDTVKTPSVIVKDRNGKTLKNGQDYSVSYSEGRIKIGEYKVTVTFKGNYSGSTVLKFKIVLGKVKTITQIADVSGVGFKWSDVYGADGYEMYHYNVLTKKYINVGNFEQTNIIYGSVNGIIRVKIRAYKFIDGNTVYGDYSDMAKFKGR